MAATTLIHHAHYKSSPFFNFRNGGGDLPSTPPSHSLSSFDRLAFSFNLCNFSVGFCAQMRHMFNRGHSCHGSSDLFIRHAVYAGRLDDINRWSLFNIQHGKPDEQIGHSFWGLAYAPQACDDSDLTHTSGASVSIAQFYENKSTIGFLRTRADRFLQWLFGGHSPDVCHVMFVLDVGLICKASLSCSWKNMNFRSQAMSTTQGNVAMPKGISKLKHEPDHLLVLVHGIFAGPSDWTYVEAELKRRLGSNFLIYASSSNTYTKTFTGIDGAGRRLADEVMQVVQKTESLKRISFLAHSLGGLFARYAIAILYSSNAYGRPDDLASCRYENPEKSTSTAKVGKIAGLEPINFITLATPHLGVRGRKQLPFLLGVPFLEKIVPPIAPVFIGRTGRQLFLTDGKPNKPPLLLRMASDCDDGNFISALRAFRCRILYANVSYDHMVGWRTSSIRRERELVKPPLRSLDGYKHVVDVEYCPPVSSDGPHFPPEAARAKEAAQAAHSIENTAEYYDILEEEMIHGLQRVGWKKVDVSFHSALWPFFAHNNIHVKSEWLHNAGAGVVAHVADTLKQQESCSFIAANL